MKHEQDVAESRQWHNVNHPFAASVTRTSFGFCFALCTLRQPAPVPTWERRPQLLPSPARLHELVRRGELSCGELGRSELGRRQLRSLQEGGLQAGG